MDMNKMTFKTNINTDVAADEVKSAFKSDRRIWSFDLTRQDEDSVLHIAGELSGAEVEAKITSLGFEAEAIE